MDKTERNSTRTKKTLKKSTNKSHSTSKNNGKSNITTVGASKDNINNGDNSDGEIVIEDENTWECSVCTYRNSQETFKCLMCDVCKGTSTRKPRYNHDLVAQKVKKQQIQIHQKLLKTSKHQQLATIDTKDSNNFNSADNPEKSTETRDSKSKDPKEGKISSKESLAGQIIEKKGHHGKESKNSGETKDGECKEGKETRVKGGGKGCSNKTSGKQSSECIEEAGPSVNFNQHSRHESTINHNKSNHNCSFSSTSSSNHNGSSSSHLTANTNNHSSKVAKSRENLVKSGNKSSLIRMKNIDRTNFLAQAVTVNNVTVIITEFQPKKKLKTTPSTKKANQRQTTGTKDED